jgi:hypothetical protein
MNQGTIMADVYKVLPQIQCPNIEINRKRGQKPQAIIAGLSKIHIRRNCINTHIDWNSKQTCLCYIRENRQSNDILVVS